MKNKMHMIRRCQALAMAGIISAGTILPAGTALAIGPGETSARLSHHQAPEAPDSPPQVPPEAREIRERLPQALPRPTPMPGKR